MIQEKDLIKFNLKQLKQSLIIVNNEIVFLKDLLNNRQNILLEIEKIVISKTQKQLGLFDIKKHAKSLSNRNKLFSKSAKSLKNQQKKVKKISKKA